MTTVLIVGAGPVGLTLAALLTTARVDVRIIDRDAGPISQSRAIWIHPRTLEQWRCLGIVDDAIEKGVLVDRIDLHSAGRQRGTVWYDGSGLTPYPAGLMLEQSVTQRILLAHLERAGIEVEWGVELQTLDQADGTVTITATKDGTVNETEAAWVVGCDGASSTVRSTIGATLEGGTYDDAFFLADIVAETPLVHGHAHLTFDKVNTVAWLPLAGAGRWRIIGNLDDPELRPGEPGFGTALSKDYVLGRIADAGVRVRVDELGWSTTYRSHHRLATAYRAGRVFIAGDAGHLHSPAGGLGMNAGVADAANLAWKLAAVVNHAASPTLLDTYETERRGAAEQILASSDKLFVLQASTSPVVAFLRRRLFPLIARALAAIEPGRRLAFKQLSGVAVSYTRRGIARTTTDHAGPASAGDRIPWFEVDGTDSLDVRPDRHRVLVTGPANTAPTLATQVNATIADLAASIDVTTVNDALVGEALGARTEPVAAWIRPDGHIGWIGTKASLLHAQLARWLEPTTTA